VVEELTGGISNRGAVTRDGDVVLRPAPSNGTTLQALLHHLSSRAFPAPRPLGVGDDGREMFEFIAGETSTPPYPHAWVRSDETLARIGRLLRSLHDATRDFLPPPDFSWSSDLSDPEGGPVICHNDVCIENVVFSEGRPVGLLDFDDAAPGRPVWDIAMTARYWVPLQDPISAAATGRDQLDPFQRVRLLADAYGADDQIRRSFTAVLFAIEDVAHRFVTSRVDQGVPAFVEMWHALGGSERHLRKMAWLTENRSRIDEAVMS
jgi:aminoglycoside phosphotransferase (APT) family kinase protein